VNGLKLILTAVLIAVNAFFVIAEYALVRSRKARLELMRESGAKGSALALTQLENVNDYISAVQIGVTLASIGIGALGEPALAALLKSALGNTISHGVAVVVAVVVAFAIISSAQLVAGADGRSSQTRKWAGFELTKDPNPFLLCGIVLKGVATRDDIAFVQFNPELGTVATIFPQTKGRFRVYLGYPSTMNYRLQGSGDVKLLFSEVARTAPALAPFLSGAECIGPLASFETDDFWVEHPYRNGASRKPAEQGV